MSDRPLPDRQADSETATGGSIVERFLTVASERPDDVAVTDGIGALTYSELASRSSGIAHRLRTLGVRRGEFVGVMLDPSADLLAAILGILQAGAAYVSLDPSYPKMRLDFVVRDSGLRWVVGDRVTTRELQDVAVVEVHDVPPAPPDSPALGTDDLAYVIYTSGTTGQPKGVMVTHGNVLSLLDGVHQIFPLSDEDVWTIFHSMNFDFSVWEMLGGLLFGGRVVMVPTATKRSPDDLLRLLERERVTVLSQVPSVFRYLVDAYERSARPALSLRAVVFGGECIDVHSLRRWLGAYRAGNVDLVNMYGITETTVFATYRFITDDDLARQGPTIIGEPLPHMDVVLLTDDMQPVPDGQPGEIWIFGPGVARGYLHRPDLTRDRFRTLDVNGRRVRAYRSGDLARRGPDGYEFLGRIDTQVKMRGFRIELEEIEESLRLHDAVVDAAVALRQTANGDDALVAFVVLRHDIDAKVELRRHLADALPRHLIPSRFVVAPQLPLGVTGKLDRGALSDWTL